MRLADGDEKGSRARMSHFFSFPGEFRVLHLCCFSTYDVPAPVSTKAQETEE